jgi:hypothetical protein
VSFICNNKCFNSHPFRPLKRKPKPNANTKLADKLVFGCFALVSPLGDGRGKTKAPCFYTEGSLYFKQIASPPAFAADGDHHCLPKGPCGYFIKHATSIIKFLQNTNRVILKNQCISHGGTEKKIQRNAKKCIPRLFNSVPPCEMYFWILGTPTGIGFAMSLF